MAEALDAIYGEIHITPPGGRGFSRTSAFTSTARSSIAADMAPRLPKTARITPTSLAEPGLPCRRTDCGFFRIMCWTGSSGWCGTTFMTMAAPDVRLPGPAKAPAASPAPLKSWPRSPGRGSRNLSHSIAACGTILAQSRSWATGESWCSDIMVQRRPGYYTSARMYSTRTLNTDGYINGENKKSHHLADGATYIFRTGEEYRDIFPVWDWKRIPGTDL